MLCGVSTTHKSAAVGRCLAPHPFSNTHKRYPAALSCLLLRSVATIVKTAGNSPHCTSVTVAAVADSAPGQIGRAYDMSDAASLAGKARVRHCVFKLVPVRLNVYGILQNTSAAVLSPVHAE